MRGWPVGWSVGWLRASPPRSVALRSRPTAIPNLWSGLVHQAAVTRRSFTRVRDSSPFEARDSVRVADHPRSWDYQGFQHISPIAPRIAALSTRHRHFRSRNFEGKRIDLVPLCFVNSESLFFFFDREFVESLKIFIRLGIRQRERDSTLKFLTGRMDLFKDLLKRELTECIFFHLEI